MEIADGLIVVSVFLFISNVLLWVVCCNLWNWQDDADGELEMLHEIMRNINNELHNKN